jgi:CRISPR/Cas system-associated exonuclease Cas4 (RecB family)
MIKHISASAITTYQDCPLMFKYQYVDKMIGLPSKALEIGKLVHKGIELFNTKQDALSILKREMITEMNKENIDMFRLVRRCVQSYIDHPVQLEKGELEGDNELMCKFDFVNSKGDTLDIPLLGCIDRATNKRIIEYKTTSEDYTQIKVDTSIQGDIYSYFYYRTYQKLPDRITYWIVNKKDVMKSIEYVPQILHTNRTVEQIDRTFDKAKEMLEKVKDNQFDAKPGNTCYYCGFRNICKSKNK